MSPRNRRPYQGTKKTIGFSHNHGGSGKCVPKMKWKLKLTIAFSHNHGSVENVSLDAMETKILEIHIHFPLFPMIMGGRVVNSEVVS